MEIFQCLVENIPLLVYYIKKKGREIMSDTEFKVIFAKNLNHLLDVRGETQADIMRLLGVSKSTVSSWCTAEKMPRMDKVEALANHFGVMKSDLIEDKGDTKKPAPEGSELSAVDQELISLLRQLNPEQSLRVMDFVRGILSSR